TLFRSEDPQQARAGCGDACARRGPRTRRGPLRQAAARRHAGTGRGLLRWRSGAWRRLDRVSVRESTALAHLLPPTANRYPAALQRPVTGLPCRDGVVMAHWTGWPDGLWQNRGRNETVPDRQRTISEMRVRTVDSCA